MLNRSTTWAVALLAGTFGAGVVVGVGGRAMWVRYAAAASPERAHGVERLMGELDRDLRLTPLQRDSVHTILQRHYTRMSEAWETVRPRFDTLRAGMDSEVSRQLTPEQQAMQRDLRARGHVAPAPGLFVLGRAEREHRPVRRVQPICQPASRLRHRGRRRRRVREPALSGDRDDRAGVLHGARE